MATILMRLVGPMQSWGTTPDRKVFRGTDSHPSKSGVIGMICSAMGADRSDDALVASLALLRFGTRVDREGSIMTDFQVAGVPLTAAQATIGSFDTIWGTIDVSRERLQSRTASGRLTEQNSVTRRQYLTGAIFLAGLEGDPDVLGACAAALRDPARPLFLGRKCCPPTQPPLIGIYQNGLEEALSSHPPMVARRGAISVRLIIESDRGLAVRDVPHSFASREMGTRFVREEFITIGG
jgi:CRISPR system Cascade subunit CasD